MFRRFIELNAIEMHINYSTCISQTHRHISLKTPTILYDKHTVVSGKSVNGFVLNITRDGLVKYSTFVDGTSSHFYAICFTLWHICRRRCYFSILIIAYFSNQRSSRCDLNGREKIAALFLTHMKRTRK